MCEDDELAVLVDAAFRLLAQPLLDSLGQLRAGDHETQLHGGRDLVDVLPAGAGAAHERKLDGIVGKEDIFIQLQWHIAEMSIEPELQAQDPHTTSHAVTTGIVLCGGRGSRFAGEDKPLVPVLGRPMIAWVLDRLKPQVGDVVVSANRNRDTYAQLGVPVIGDAPDLAFAGPLAGIHAALARCDGQLAFVCPGDLPLLPVGLVARLQAGFPRDGSPGIAVVHDGSRMQPLLLLLDIRLRDPLGAFLRGGGRTVQRWLADLDPVQVDCRDWVDCFVNVNTPADLEHVRSRLSAGR
jgi:molybdenum cofactor guanylyltransferase